VTTSIYFFKGEVLQLSMASAKPRAKRVSMASRAALGVSVGCLLMLPLGWRVSTYFNNTSGGLKHQKYHKKTEGLM
jgi:hypothetical protein